jgi:hypothetical protein
VPKKKEKEGKNKKGSSYPLLWKTGNLEKLEVA